MNVINRYKSIMAASFSDIHSHRHVSFLGCGLCPDAKRKFDDLKGLVQAFLRNKKPREDFLCEIIDKSESFVIFLDCISLWWNS